MVLKSARSVRKSEGDYDGKDLWKKVSFESVVEERRIDALFLLTKYNIPSLLLSRDTIKRCMCGISVSKTVNAGYISIHVK